MGGRGAKGSKKGGSSSIFSLESLRSEEVKFKKQITSQEKELKLHRTQADMSPAPSSAWRRDKVAYDIEQSLKDLRARLSGVQDLIRIQSKGEK